MTKNFCIISHDGGGANILSLWSKKNKKKNIFSVNGPAKKIFANNIGKFLNTSISKAISNSRIVISSTGHSNYEKKAMLLAKNKNKKLIAYLDHWVNYRERFIYKKKIIQPNEIWVSDHFALNAAKKIFKKIPIKLKKNYYYYFLKNKIKKKNKEKYNFLYLSGLIFFRRNLSEKKLPKFNKIEFIALKKFLHFVNYLKISNKNINFKVRFHPAEKKILFLKKIVNLNVSNNSLLWKDFNWASHVFGANSAGLYYSSKLKIPTVICLGNSNKNLILPKKLEFTNLKKFIKNFNDKT